MRATSNISSARFGALFPQDIATPLTALDEICAKNVCHLARSPEGTPWVEADSHIFDGKGSLITKTMPGCIAIGFLPDGRVAQLTSTHLFLTEAKNGGKPLCTFALPRGTRAVDLAVSPEGSCYVGALNGVWKVHIHPSSNYPCADGFGHLLPHVEVRAIAAGSYGALWVAQKEGLLLYMGGDKQDVHEVAPMPVTDIVCMDVGPDGCLWIGTPRGAARLRDGRWRYFAGRRWLPENRVVSLASDGAGGAWIATPGGVVHIKSHAITLEQKAAHYQTLTEQRHNRNGYVTDCFLTRRGDLESVLHHASDNDGLWTSLYVAAQSFRYAVNKEPAAAEAARKSMKALLDLVYVTGIPGFPARALIRPGERVYQSDPGPLWHLSPTMPGTFYKADTSSDEIDGHYLAWYIFSALVACAQEREEIARVCEAVTDHILDHGYKLVGPDGKVTTWGVWAPEKINDDPEWADEHGLNALEILSHLRVAIYLCSQEKRERYEASYRELVEKHHYALNTLTQKVLPPKGAVNHSDDELAACAYYPLLQLETDPYLQALYLMSLERTQRILRPERSALHNILYAACTGHLEDVGPAITWLQESPWDLRNWGMDNSHRRDVTLVPSPDRFGELQLQEALSPAELKVYRWNANPYVPDRPGDGDMELDGTHWLLPYWMGRYHGLIP